MILFRKTMAVRGAVCCENTVDSVSTEVPALYGAILGRNRINERHIVSVVFSVTSDIDCINPATALRKAGLAADVPLFAAAEPSIAGMLPRVIRVLVTWRGRGTAVPVYLNGAEALRPDIATSHAGADRSR